MDNSLPVLLIAFNRPFETQQVFNRLRELKVENLFISLDGPREGNELDKVECEKVRNIVKNIDWNCNYHYRFNDKNLGCRDNVSSSISWFFEHVEEGAILEDDCLPGDSFFYFCRELLAYYRNDERIMQISGNNFLFGEKPFKGSYYFSRLNSIWGWATWKRAWKYYDPKMQGFEDFKNSKTLENYLNNKEISSWLMSYLDDAFYGPGKIWSPIWVYAIAKRDGLTIIPEKNLVQNIGFLGTGTNVSNDSCRIYSEVKAQKIEKIIHPECIEVSEEADRLRFKLIRKTDERLFLKTRIKRFLSKKFPYLKKIYKKLKSKKKRNPHVGESF